MDMHFDFGGFVPSERISKLKAAYLDARPSITIDRALAFTLVAMEQPDLPPQLRIARSFRKACETAPLLIQDDELIVGHPCGRPRAGALSLPTSPGSGSTTSWTRLARGHRTPTT